MSRAKLSQVELSELSRVKPSQVEPSGGGLIRVEPIQAKLSQAKMSQAQLKSSQKSHACLKFKPSWELSQVDSSQVDWVEPTHIFLIALGAEYSFYVKFIATYAPQKVDIIILS